MVDQIAIQNRLLARLPAEDFAALSKRLERFEFALGTEFADSDQPISHVYFLESGMASIVVRSPEGQSAEGGIIGREGFVAPAVLLGSDRSPLYIQAQLTGSAYRIDRSALLDAMSKHPVLHDRLQRFGYVASVQASFTLLSNAVHQVDERLARWLLMCHARVDSDDMQLTHEFMSVMLAVRRPSVTNALHVLEGNGFITAERGYVVMRNRTAMEEFARDAYGTPESEYRRLLGPFK